MRKVFICALAAVIVGSTLAMPGYAQTVQDILKKMIDTQGGRSYLESIKDTTSSGSLELTAMGMSGTFTQYQKEPNKFRMDAEVAGMVITQAYDGQKAWGTNFQTGQVEESPEAQAKEMARQAMGNGALLHPEKFGVTYTLKPKAKLEDKEYIVIEQKTADGHLTTIYLDPATYLPYKTETMTLGQAGVEVKAESYPSDYKKIGQSLVPHAIRVVQEGNEYIKITITKVVFNSNLEDALFAMGK